MSTGLSDILAGLQANGDNKTLEAMSQAAEAAERYEDMALIMDAIVTDKLNDNMELTTDQRNLLSVAYKNVVGAKRSSWRMLNEDSQFEDVELVGKYRKKVESELEETCKKVLVVLEKLAEQNKDRLDTETAEEKKAVHGESQVFYLKMIGDYYRYLTEAFPLDNYKGNCRKYYQDAMMIADDCLEATHPTRLGLALNYSVCHYEILNQPDKARELAKKAFDDAIEKLDSLQDASYRDSTLIMQLLRDNITIWNQNNDEIEQAADKDQ